VDVLSGSFGQQINPLKIEATPGIETHLSIPTSSGVSKKSNSV
jgi:hypothetical protein